MPSPGGPTNLVLPPAQQKLLATLVADVTQIPAGEDRTLMVIETAQTRQLQIRPVVRPGSTRFASPSDFHALLDAGVLRRVGDSNNVYITEMGFAYEQRLRKDASAPQQNDRSKALLATIAPERKLRVFLCHSSNDKQPVREVYQRLTAAGIDAWLDEEKLLPGQDWDYEIQAAVRRSDVVLVFLSQGSVTKEGYLQKEIRQVLDVADEKPEGTIFVIPVRLEDCPLPSRLRRWQYVDLLNERSSQRIMRSLELRARQLGIDIVPPLITGIVAVGFLVVFIAVIVWSWMTEMDGAA